MQRTGPKQNRRKATAVGYVANDLRADGMCTEINPVERYMQKAPGHKRIGSK